MGIPLVNDVVTRIVNVAWEEGGIFVITSPDYGLTSTDNEFDNARQYSADGDNNWGYVITGRKNPRDCAVDLDGNCIIVGTVPTAVAGEIRIFVQKLTSDGEEDWLVETDPQTSATEPRVATDSQGNILVSYQFTLASAQRTTILVYSPVGLQTANTLLDASFRAPRAIETDGEDNYYLAHADSGGTQGRLTKFSPTGSQIWQQSLTGGGGGTVALAVDGEQNVFVVNGSSLGKIYKFSSGGTQLWSIDGPEPGSSNPFRALASDGENLYACGYGVVEKYDTNGAELWSVEAPKASEELDVRSQPVRLTDITADADGVYVTGEGWDHNPAVAGGQDQIALFSNLSGEDGSVVWTVELDLETDKSLTIIANDADWIAVARPQDHK